MARFVYCCRECHTKTVVSTDTTMRYGDIAGRTRAEVVAILNAHGHTLTT